MEGLLGLNKSINTTESAIRDLSVLENMNSHIQQDRAAEVNAQKEEQMMYERMYQMSDQMLEKDRKMINKKISMSQSQITDHLRDSGGSRKRFMEQGGLSIIGNVSNDIMRSDEAVRYQENKKNLAKILEAREKGLGHLISPRDQKSLEDYERNPNGGAITYSGIMSEIEMPPSEQFDYGTEIPLERILSNKSNMMRITANYKLNYPDKPEPNYADIFAFAKKMGYGGLGSNTMRMRAAAAEATARAKANAANAAKNGKVIPNSYLNQLNVLKKQVPEGINVQDINTKYEGNLIESLAKNNPSFKKLLSGKFEPTSRKRKLPRAGFDSTDIVDSGDDGLYDSANALFVRLTNDKYGLKEAHRIMPHNTNEIATRLFNEKIENGMILDFVPAESDYSMTGEKLTGSNKMDPEKTKGNYKLLGATTALKGTVKNGGDVLFMNAYDEDGTTLDSTSKELDEAYNKSGVQLTTVMAYENDNGDIFYREIDISDPQIKTVFSNALGDDDDITDTVDQDNQSAALLNQIEKISAEEEIRLRGSIKSLDEKVFQDPLFNSEGENYFGAGSGGQENRYPLMKSFYMAFDYMNNSYKRNEQFPNGDQNVYPKQITQAIDNELFTTSAIQGGIEETLKSYEQGNNDTKIISQWLQNVNKDENSLTIKQNTELAQKWLQMLSLME